MNNENAVSNRGNEKMLPFIASRKEREETQGVASQWTEKYRPKTFEEIKGQDEAIEQIKKFMQEFPNKKKAILLGGAPGIGKTTIAHVFAKELNKELFELNASDLRNKLKLQEILKPAIQQMSLTKKDKIILIDEVDGISGSDRGGIPELTRLIVESPYLIIITANDVWHKKLSPLRKLCELIELKEPNESIIRNLLIEILRKENKFLSLEILNQIIINSKKDFRGAINDLQTTAHLEKPEEVLVDERNKEESIFNILKIIFQEKATNSMLGLFDKVNMSLDEIILWVEENIPNVYSGEELVKAYQRLANVDLFKGRIYKQQYWRFIVYENIFLSYGISASKKQEKLGFFKYKRPERILKIWLNNQKTFKKKSIAEKYARKTHVGQKRIMSEWEEIKNILKNPLVQKELKLDEDEINYLKRY